MKTGMDISKRAVYKELNSLENACVLTRVKNNYVVSFKWLLEIQRYTDIIYQNALSPKRLSELLPESGKTRTWYFNDLRRLSSFWLELMFLLFQLSKEKQMYEWLPRFWFYLVGYEQELQTQRAMIVAGNKIHMAIGGDSFLDKYHAKNWNKKVYSWTFGKKVFKNLNDTYFSIIDDYIITCKLDYVTYENMESLFNLTNKLNPNTFTRSARVLSQPCHCKISIECKPRKARKLINNF